MDGGKESLPRKHKNMNTIKHDGKILTLTQQAYLSVDPVTYANPNAGKPCYLASAKDSDGNDYRVTWYPYEGFDGDDAGDSCDWENPDRIEEV